MNKLTSDFREYASIDNYKERLINRLKMLGHVDNIEWVCMEKIHGANFSFLTNGYEILTAKRSGILPETENFYHSKDVVEKYSADILQIFSRVKQNFSDVLTIQVFGELFGGFYPGIKSLTIPVQKGIWYCPEIDFLVFDIKINICSSNIHRSYYLSQDEVNQYLKNLSKLRGIPIMKKGNLYDILSTDINFVSTIPDLYNLPSIEGNIAEGLVFKSNARHSVHISRPIFKHKNTVWSETKTLNFVKQKENPTSGVMEKDLIQKAILYCTQNRFNNLLTKVGLDEKLEKITGLYVSDVMNDFKKDLLEDNENRYSEFPKYRKSICFSITDYLKERNLISDWLGKFVQDRSVF